MPSRRLRAIRGRAAASASALALAASFMLGEAAAQQANPNPTANLGLGLRGDITPLDETPSGLAGLPPVPSDDTTAADAAADTTPSGTANYGKPKPPYDPAKHYPGLPATFKNPLPALVPYPTSATTAERKKGELSSDASEPDPTAAIIPTIPKKPRPKVDADPFAPVGVDVGSLRLVPYVEVDGGYDSNPGQLPGASRGSPILRGETGLTLKSDWSEHQLTGELHAGYTDVLAQRQASSPDDNGKLDLRLDATRDTAIDFEARGTLATQSAGTPILGTTQVAVRPLVSTVGGTAGLTQKFGDASLGLHGTIDRTDYADAKLPDGSVLVLSGDSYTAYGLKARAGYELTPGVMPFVEVDVDTRRHDQEIDSSGYDRNSNGQAILAGTSFELTRLLTGEIDGGYAEREYADARLARLRGPTFDASLVWSVTPLTTITLKGNTTLSETTTVGSPGAVTRTISLELAHQLLDDLKLDAVGSYGTNSYEGVSLFERTYSGTFSAVYNLSRSLLLKASASTQRFRSTSSGSDYTEDKFLLGLELQR